MTFKLKLETLVGVKQTAFQARKTTCLKIWQERGRQTQRNYSKLKWLESSGKGESEMTELEGTRQHKTFPVVVKNSVLWTMVMEAMQDFKQENDCDSIYIIQSPRARPEAREPAREYCHRLWEVGFDPLGTHWFSLLPRNPSFLNCSPKLALLAVHLLLLCSGPLEAQTWAILGVHLCGFELNSGPKVNTCFPHNHGLPFFKRKRQLEKRSRQPHITLGRNYFIFNYLFFGHKKDFGGSVILSLFNCPPLPPMQGQKLEEQISGLTSEIALVIEVT